MLRYLPFLLVLALWIYAFIDCLNTPESQVRGLPKVVWVLIILLFGEVLIGPIAWLVAGKERHRVAGGGGSTPSEWHRNHSTRWVAPDDNPEFLRSLREENTKDEALLKDWEADLRRREEELRRKEAGTGGSRDGASGADGADGTGGADGAGGRARRNGPEDTPPATS
ncbi:PLD nuclease N-terminal domain-containing protein [Streptomyces sp. RS10V-4]|uniref:PLD nuclease N-terminal domain-containing protein n=1 Tax=Streptomyces rhizoryzae TaxID=2932493 RepID=UPI0020031085|nr:PLD nuclease N-terminal domain-containing protein [Streptomyces rhizoryzae]MCK7623615.1 PLD nuclease N-terminal domain-containing protein [Streptomyces rhizoryzae]